MTDTSHNIRYAPQRNGKTTIPNDIADHDDPDSVRVGVQIANAIAAAVYGVRGERREREVETTVRIRRQA